MTVSYSMPKLLHKLSLGLKYGGTVLAVLAVFLSGWIVGLIALVCFWVLAILCDAVAELYHALEQDHQEETVSE